MELAHLSWPEVEGYLSKRKDIILPFGSVEEHGHHLPLSTDGDIAYALARELGKRQGLLVAPIVWYGVCNTTRSYPGTISVDFDGFKGFVTSLLSNLEAGGFQRIYVISGHLGGSHVSAIKEASRNMDAKVFFLDLRAVSSGDILETRPFHACEAETSLMLHLHPDRVDMSRAVDEEIVMEGFSITSSVKKTTSGVWGCPSKASAAKGQMLFERMIETFEKAFK